MEWRADSGLESGTINPGTGCGLALSAAFQGKTPSGRGLAHDRILTFC